MKLTGLFKRGAACLCTAAILMGGVSAFALSPALPDEPAPAELSVTNAVSEAQLRSALSKLTVTYDSEAELADRLSLRGGQHGKGLLRSVPLPVRYQR